jgi:hypothetical protein
VKLQRSIQFVTCAALVSTPYVYATSQTNHQNQPQRATVTKPTAPVIVAKPSPVPPPTYRPPTTGAGSTSQYSPPNSYRAPPALAPAASTGAGSVRAPSQPSYPYQAQSPFPAPATTVRPAPSTTATGSAAGIRAPVVPATVLASSGQTTASSKPTVSGETTTIKPYVTKPQFLGSSNAQCVPWARDNGKSNLPYGLNTYADKKAIINQTSPAVGYAAIHNISNNGVGHVSIVTGVDQGDLKSNRPASVTIKEANYVPGSYSTRTAYGATVAEAQQALHITGYFN